MKSEWKKTKLRDVLDAAFGGSITLALQGQRLQIHG